MWSGVENVSGHFAVTLAGVGRDRPHFRSKALELLVTDPSDLVTTQVLEVSGGVSGRMRVDRADSLTAKFSAIIPRLVLQAVELFVVFGHPHRLNCRGAPDLTARLEAVRLL